MKRKGINAGLARPCEVYKQCEIYKQCRLNGGYAFASLVSLRSSARVDGVRGVRAAAARGAGLLTLPTRSISSLA